MPESSKETQDKCSYIDITNINQNRRSADIYKNIATKHTHDQQADANPYTENYALKPARNSAYTSKPSNDKRIDESRRQRDSWI